MGRRSTFTDTPTARTRAPALARAAGSGATAAATRRRLLEAAGAVFAEHGYRGGAVREICSRAGANVSAVAYHFGSKAALYEAVIRSAQEYAAERYPIGGLAEHARADAEEALHRFVRTFLRRLLDRGRPAWHGRLMTRELADPSPAFGIIVNEVARPMFVELAAIVSVLTGQPPASPRTQLAVTSIMGQCTVYRNARALLAAIAPGSSADIEALARHITAFSLAGLRAGNPGVTTTASRSGSRARPQAAGAAAAPRKRASRRPT